MQKDTLKLLSEKGYKLTRPRLAVIEVLEGDIRPLSIGEIHRRMADRGVNLVSVYRTVNLLLKLDVVRRLEFGEGFRRYELAEGYRGHHHHLVCNKCGRIEDFHGCPLKTVEETLRDSTGFETQYHRLEFYGTCQGCS